MNKEPYTRKGCADEYEATPFQLRSYGKTELAVLYLPELKEESARKTFIDWIKHHPKLPAALTETGLMPKAKIFNPLQVRLIIEALGTP